MPPSARFALQLAFRTVQRRLTAVSALKTSFRPHDTYGMVWWIHPGILKVGRNRAGEVRRHPHVIPLPPSAQQIVRTALALTRPDNPYLFPQLRLRHAGDAGDGPLNRGETPTIDGFGDSPGWTDATKRDVEVEVGGGLGMDDDDRFMVGEAEFRQNRFGRLA